MYALAETIGVDESTISRWRRDKPISTTNLIKLCDALDLSVDWLLTGRGAMQAMHVDQWCDLLSCKLAALGPDHATRLAELLYLLGKACETAMLSESRLHTGKEEPSRSLR